MVHLLARSCRVLSEILVSGGVRDQKRGEREGGAEGVGWKEVD